MSEFVDITFRVNTSELFDTIANVGDGGASIGQRLAHALLAPNDVLFTERVGMAFYGVEIARVEPVSDPAQPVAKE